ncbi:MAG TPA: nucleotide exchange factor GrpE [Chitinispirillaceae bacterium]|nr:nucleotide exchange factor GrpE [Chitinispirillaceae bacterium]
MADKKNKKEAMEKEMEEETLSSEAEAQKNAGASDESAESADTAKKTESKSAAETEAQEAPAETVDDLKAEIKNWNDRYLRLMAEFDNYKKRSSREYQALVDSANERLMTDLVEVRENFERAVKNGEKSTDYNVLFDGLKLIFSKFDTVLSKHGLEIFGAPGEEFDPMIHDALMKAVHNEIPEDHVADIYERGYKLKGKVMKHARVIVSSGKPAENTAGDKSQE